MITIKADFKGASLTGRGLAVINREFRRAMTKSVIYAESQIAGLTPVGATAQLRQGIAGEVKTPFLGIVGVAGSAGKYSDIVEVGRRPGRFPPPDAIEFWLRRSNKGKAFVASVAATYDLNPERALKSATYLKSRGIARRGTRGQRMFEKGTKRAEHRVVQFFTEALNRLAKLL